MIPRGDSALTGPRQVRQQIVFGNKLDKTPRGGVAPLGEVRTRSPVQIGHVMWCRLCAISIGTIFDHFFNVCEALPKRFVPKSVFIFGNLVKFSNISGK